MEGIESVEELVEALKTVDPKEYVAIAKHMKIPAEDFEPYAFWDEEGYSRNCIERTDVFELILICWKPGDATPIHGHSEQRCWVHQVSGTCKEVLYKKNKEGVLEPYRDRTLQPGGLSYMEDRMGYHTLENSGTQKAMSLHLYVAPIDSCQVFDENQNRFHEKEMSYHTYKGAVETDRVSA